MRRGPQISTALRRRRWCAARCRRVRDQAKAHKVQIAGNGETNLSVRRHCGEGRWPLKRVRRRFARRQFNSQPAFHPHIHTHPREGRAQMRQLAPRVIPQSATRLRHLVQSRKHQPCATDGDGLKCLIKAVRPRYLPRAILIRYAWRLASAARTSALGSGAGCRARPDQGTRDDGQTITAAPSV